MIEWVMGLYQSVLDQTAHMPQAQAALVTISSVSVVGLFGFLLVKLPRAIANFFRDQCMTSLIFNTAGSTYTDYNQMQYLAFLKWFSKNSWFNWSRVISFDGEASNTRKGATGPGVGTHFFMFRRRFFFFTIREMDSQGTSYSKYKISISVIGRNKKHLYDLMNEFMLKDDSENTITVFESGKQDWNWVTTLERRGIENYILSEKIKRELIKPLIEFQNNKDWYIKRGLDYKFTALLYGPPGTGKSSLARLIASLLNRNLYLLSMGAADNYLRLFQGAKGGVVLMEDIDAFGITRKRTGQTTDVEEGVVVTSEEETSDQKDDLMSSAISEFMTGSLSELLNALQGVLPLDDLIVLMTTNHPEKLDPALIRDGRVDVRIEIGYLNHEDIACYHKLVYEQDYVGPDFPSLPAATVHKAFLMNKFSPEGFTVDLLDKKGDNVFQLTSNGE